MKLTLAKNLTEIQLDPADIELETICTAPHCTLGRLPSGAPCPVCEGTGAVVTPLGMHFLAFVVRYGAKYRAALKAAAAARGEKFPAEILPAFPKTHA